ncbi:ROK family protein (putative glucokinase) [Streptomyces sp. BvitLS-983]|nr:ROK family protein (putative glucokinase) [Streptomyces sp. BvitLS-983]
MGLTIGVDIGGTKIAAGVVDEEGAILNTFTVPTPATAEAIVDAIASAVEGAREGHEIEAVGIGAAGYVDDKRATVLFAPNIDWRHEPLKDKVEQRVGLPVVVENDANAAAWGEYRFGAGKGHDDVICITLGTGLGGGIIIGNKLRRGRFGVAAEFGHIRVVPDGLLCGCGSQGCWEQYASGRALVRYARQRAAATPENAVLLLSLGDGTTEGIQGKHVSEAARQGGSCRRRLVPGAGAVGRGRAGRSRLALRPVGVHRRWGGLRTRGSWCSTRFGSRSGGGSSVGLGGPMRRCSPPSWAGRLGWSVRPTLLDRAEPGAGSFLGVRPGGPGPLFLPRAPAGLRSGAVRLSAPVTDGLKRRPGLECGLKRRPGWDLPDCGVSSAGHRWPQTPAGLGERRPGLRSAGGLEMWPFPGAVRWGATRSARWGRLRWWGAVNLGGWSTWCGSGRGSCLPPGGWAGTSWCGCSATTCGR